MPNICVVYGCNNVADSSRGIMVHKFPKDPKIRKAWVTFVKKKRADFSEPGSGSVICSLHFADDCYEVHDELSSNTAGYKPNKREKKKDAIPSITFHFPKKSEAATPVFEPHSVDVERAGSTSNVRRRGAAEKRERQRVLEAAFTEYEQSLLVSESGDCTGDHVDDGPDCFYVSDVEESCAAQEKKTVTTHNKGIQVNIKPQTRVKWQTYRYKPGRRSLGIQTNCQPAVSTVTVNSDEFQPQQMMCSTPKAKKRIIVSEDLDQESEFGDKFTDDHDDKDDPDWTMSMSYDLSQDETISEEEKPSSIRPQLVAVEVEKLMKLFQVCQRCGLKKGTSASITSTEGSLVTVTQTCLACEDPLKWRSQVQTGQCPAGNIALSTAILCAGALPGKTLRVLQLWGMQSISLSTFFTHQRKYLHHAVREVWEMEQADRLQALGPTAEISGDARCDSMGHCAKYGSYSLHHTEENKIICTELVQSTEVKSSFHMEIEGLQRALSIVNFTRPDVVMNLTTDGHTQIAKYLREEKADTVKHYLDIWHVAKNLWKKLSALAKRFPLVGKWMRAIRNHLYWVAISSDGNSQLMVAKWKSLPNHIAGIHEHDDPLFQKCAHGEISPRQWFDVGSEAYDRIRALLLKKNLLNAVSRLSPNGQTSGLEGFHSTVTQFAPKMYHFPYNGMKSRLQIAALHFNENANRQQRYTKEGKACESIHFPKAKHGEYVARQVKVKPTYGYVDTISQEVTKLVQKRKSYEIREDPPALCASYIHPNKEEAVAERNTRRRYKPK